MVRVGKKCGNCEWAPTGLRSGEAFDCYPHEDVREEFGLEPIWIHTWESAHPIKDVECEHYDKRLILK